MQARVEHGHHSTILVRAQEPPQPLFEAQHRLRQDIGAKPVFTGGFHPLDPGFVDRVIGWVKRQLINHNQGERFTGDIYPFPEALQSKQDRPRYLAERAYELDARQVALAQQRKIQVGGELFVDLVECPPA